MSECTLVLPAGPSPWLSRHDGESGERQLQDEELQEQSFESSGDASKERGGRNPAAQTEERGAGKHGLTFNHLIKTPFTLYETLCSIKDRLTDCVVAPKCSPSSLVVFWNTFPSYVSKHQQWHISDLGHLGSYNIREYIFSICVLDEYNNSISDKLLLSPASCSEKWHQLLLYVGGIYINKSSKTSINLCAFLFVCAGVFGVTISSSQGAKNINSRLIMWPWLCAHSCSRGEMYVSLQMMNQCWSVQSRIQTSAPQCLSQV